MRTLMLIAALNGAGHDTPTGEDQDRLHSIRNLVGPTHWSNDALSLLPYRWSSNGDADIFMESDEQRGMYPEDVMTLVRECVVPEYWDSLGNMDVVGDQLLVSASGTVQDEVRRFLANLSEAAVSQGRLHVHVYRGRIGLDEALARPTEDSKARLDTLIDQGQLEDLRHVSLGIPRGLLQRAESLDVVSLPYGYDSEIAEGAVNATATFATIATGLSVLSRSSRTQEATLVDLLLRHAEEVGRDLYDTDGGAWISTDSGIQRLEHGGMVEHPRLTFASLATSVLIPDGQTLWIPISLDLVTGAMDTLITLQVENPRPVSRSRIAVTIMAWGDDAQPSRHQLCLHDASFLCRRGISAPGIPNTLFDFARDTFWDSDQLVANYEVEGTATLEVDTLMDVLRSSCDPDAWDEDPRNTVSVHGSWLVTTCPPELADQIDRVLGDLAGARASVARGSLERDGRVVGHFALPMVEGLAGTLWAGVQGTGLASWEVEVANRATCAYPQLQAVVDGLAVNLHPSPGSQGSVGLEVNGKVHLLTEAPRLMASSNDPRDSRSTTRVKTRSLAMDDRVKLRPGGEAFRFGNGRAALNLKLDARKN